MGLARAHLHLAAASMLHTELAERLVVLFPTTGSSKLHRSRCIGPNEAAKARLHAGDEEARRVGTGDRREPIWCDAHLDLRDEQALEREALDPL
eukprot:531736-Prymnesium_polylepis.1